MSTSSARVVTAPPVRPSVLSSIRRHIAAIVPTVVFAVALGGAIALTVTSALRARR